ncbi:DNA-processing protein DprA [Candidatus Babeliales bacterium]|nr:DNA-processing protein DprA [Candidatus Babeliales bacterium]
MTNTTTLLHLSLIKNIGPGSVLKIIHALHKNFYEISENPQLAKPTFDLSQFYQFTTREFQTKFDLTPRISQLLVTGLADRETLEEELLLIKKYNIDLLSFLDDGYPEMLKQIHHPPLIIYCKGAPLGENKRLGIVGSRKADSYAKQSINAIVPELVSHDWEIVSGGALGVDSMAHRATLNAGGKTIVVFGSGLMQPYPSENKELFRSVVRNGGTLVSAFSLNTTPHKGNFPARNRIIAGLSQGCIIVQAAQRSGALITAQFSLDQGRQVFALPGKIDNELSAGCHKIIQQGAKLVTNVEDILEEFGETAQEALAPVTEASQPTPARPECFVKQNVSRDTSIHPLIKLLEEPCSLDEIASKTKQSLEELQNELFQLQLEGKIKQNFAGLWETCPGEACP